MKWQEARLVFPDRWVVIEAIESHLEGVDVKLDEIAVLATTTNGHEMMRLYGQWRNKLREKGRFSSLIQVKRYHESKTIVIFHLRGIIFHVKKKSRWRFLERKTKVMAFGNRSIKN